YTETAAVPRGVRLTSDFSELIRGASSGEAEGLTYDTWPSAVPVGVGFVRRVSSSQRNLSVAIAADKIPVGLGAEGPPDLPVDVVFDEAHGAVAETDVEAAGVHATGAVGETAIGIVGGAAVEPAGRERELPVIRCLNCVEHCVACDPHRPAVAV